MAMCEGKKPFMKVVFVIILWEISSCASIVVQLMTTVEVYTDRFVLDPTESLGVAMVCLICSFGAALSKIFL